MPLDRRVFASIRPSPRPPFLQWSYRQVRPGQRLRGWIAGPGIPVACHWMGCSKPCRKRMTGGALACEMCDPGRLRERLITYQPLFEYPSCKQIVITASESISLAVLDFAFSEFVDVGRSNGQRDPLRVGPTAAAESQRLPERLYRAGPQDLTEWLLHLWDDPVLASHFRASAGASVEQNSDSPTPPAVVDSAASPPTSRSDHHGERAPPAAAAADHRPGPAALGKLRAWLGGAGGGEPAAAEQPAAAAAAHTNGKRRKK